jgi:predicted MFS family arabinose efflux permease
MPPQASAVPAAAARPLWLVVLAAGAIVGIAMGRAQVMGLYMVPMTGALQVGRETMALSLGLAQLVTGLFAPFAGGFIDKLGAGRVIVACAFVTMAGLALFYIASGPTELILAGILTGVGVSGTGVTALVGTVGRLAPPEKRLAAIASLGMASGIGGFLAYPYAHLFMELLGWRGSLLALMATTAVMIPLAWPLRGAPPPPLPGERRQTVREALGEAFTTPSYLLLVIGFFVCGFHVAYIQTHLPAYTLDLGLPSWVGPMALSVVGIANIIGTFVAGQSGRWISKRSALALIYFGRALVFIGFLYVPMTPVTVIVLAGTLGLLWLATVPLTSSLVATFFGTVWMSMLFGIVFLSHQIGSFLGVWLAGRLFDSFQSYEVMWWISIALGLAASLVHLMIREEPVERVAAETRAAAAAR